MDDQFFGEGCYFDTTLEPSQSFAGIPGASLANENHPEDSTSQFVRNFGWSDELFNLQDLGPDGLEANDIQPDNIHPSQFCPHDGIYHKIYANGQGTQAPHQPDILSLQNSNHVRPRGISPYAGFQCRHNLEDALAQESGRPLMYRNPSICGPDFMLQAQHMLAFDNTRGGNNLNIQPPPFAAQFTAADLGTLSQYPNADDAVSLVCSQTSCNSKCTSSVCEDEECSATGIPCDDPTCVETFSPSQMLCLTHQLPTQMTSGPIPLHQTHTQPCNHTESEHLVAQTLGELRAPTEIYAQEKASSYTVSFDPALASRTGEHLYDDSCRSYVSPPLSAEFECSVPNYTQISLQTAPSAVAAPSENVYTCQWITNPHARPGESRICGAQFANTKKFHEHVCESHTDKLTSSTGFACLWEGCSRDPDKPFVTRGKLRRHISTHSVCKWGIGILHVFFFY